MTSKHRRAPGFAEADSPRRPAKRAVNLRISSSLIEEARMLGLNLSDVLQTSLEARVREELSTKFARENAEALSSIDTFFGEHGSLSEHFAAEFG